MASSAFKMALAAQTSGKRKDLGGLIIGQYLGEGEHDVTIQGVDTQYMENDQLAVSYAAGDGKVYNERMFILDYKDKEAFSYALRQFWSGLIPDQAAINKFILAAGAGDNVWGVFTGMKCQITLKRGPGFKISAAVDDSGDKKYVAVDAQDGKELTEQFYSAQEAEDAAVAANHRKSYLRIGNIAATDKEANLDAFYTAIEKVTGAAKSAGNPSGGNAGAAKAAPTI